MIFTQINFASAFKDFDSMNKRIQQLKEYLEVLTNKNTIINIQDCNLFYCNFYFLL